jgi:hypothetical protein
MVKAANRPGLAARPDLAASSATTGAARQPPKRIWPLPPAEVRASIFILAWCVPVPLLGILVRRFAPGILK